MKSDLGSDLGSGSESQKNGSERRHAAAAAAAGGRRRLPWPCRWSPVRGRGGRARHRRDHRFRCEDISICIFQTRC